jgi:hypothetical protein
MITAAEIADEAQVCRQSITRLARQNRIGTRLRIGWVFTEQEAKKLIKLVQPVGRPPKYQSNKRRKNGS